MSESVLDKFREYLEAVMPGVVLPDRQDHPLTQRDSEFLTAFVVSAFRTNYPNLSRLDADLEPHLVELDQHIIEFDRNDWSLHHPLSCRRALLDCPFHKEIAVLARGWKAGTVPAGTRYEVIETADGRIGFRPFDMEHSG